MRFDEIGAQVNKLSIVIKVVDQASGVFMAAAKSRNRFILAANGYALINRRGRNRLVDIKGKK